MTVFVWDTDINSLNSIAIYEPHPDDLENELKIDRSRAIKAQFKQEVIDKKIMEIKENY